MIASMRPEALSTFPIWASGLLITGVAVAGAVVVELIARRLVPMSVRETHNAVASAMFTVIGTTYAVLLAFVAMLAWDGSNHAQSVTQTEASLTQSVYDLVGGITGPQGDPIRQDIVAYATAVVGTEWPAMAAGIAVQADEPSLMDATQRILRFRADNAGDAELRALLLGNLDRLGMARRERLMAERTGIPPIVWYVLIGGGAITVAFGSFLAAPSLGMHLAMSSLLALSGGLVLLVIVALSSPFRGEFRITPEPFQQVLARMPAP